MKKTVRPYIKYLLRENFPYIVVLALLLAATILIGLLMGGKLTENQDKITSLQKELDELNLKQRILSSALTESTQTLDNNVEILQSLIPDVEDYFSIVYAFDEISKNTNFLITSYIINLEKSTRNKLALTVLGVGDSSSFLKFLNEYNVGGGRLITAEKIELGPEEGGGIKLSLNLYNKRVSALPDKNLDYQGSLAKLAQIRDKVRFVIKSSDEVSAIDEAYPVKSDPF